LFIEKHYIIQPQFMYMMSHYDRHGKLCTLIIETNRTFIVDQSPQEILKESIRRIGFSLQGAIDAAKYYLGDVNMCPIMVNPILRIVLFPTRSPKHEETIWLNPQQIRRTTSINGRAMITFNNEKTLVVAARLPAFNTKLQNAEQLEKMTRIDDPEYVSFVIDPKKRRTKDKQ